MKSLNESEFFFVLKKRERKKKRYVEFVKQIFFIFSYTGAEKRKRKKASENAYRQYKNIF